MKKIKYENGLYSGFKSNVAHGYYITIYSFFSLLLFIPNIYYHMFPLSVPQCHHCWHPFLSLLILYMLHKHLLGEKDVELRLYLARMEIHWESLQMFCIFRSYFSNDYYHNTALHQCSYAEARQSGPLPWRQMPNRQQAVWELWTYQGHIISHCWRIELS